MARCDATPTITTIGGLVLSVCTLYDETLIEPRTVPSLKNLQVANYCTEVLRNLKVEHVCPRKIKREKKRSDIF
jgi:hypothetical protein